MIYKIDHIGVAVENIEKALNFYSESLQIKCTDVEYIENQSARVAILPVGDSEIELLEPTDDESTIKKFIKMKGEGIHHIAFKVASIEEEVKRLKDIGLMFIGDTVSEGAGGSKIAFLHPKSTGGVLVELCERQDL